MQRAAKLLGIPPTPPPSTPPPPTSPPSTSPLPREGEEEEEEELIILVLDGGERGALEMVLPVTLLSLAHTGRVDVGRASERVAAQFCLDNALESSHILPLAAFVARYISTSRPRKPVHPTTPSWLARGSGSAEKAERAPEFSHHPSINAKSRAIIERHKRAQPSSASSQQQDENGAHLCSVFERLYARKDGKPGERPQGEDETHVPESQGGRRKKASRKGRRADGLSVVQRLVRAGEAKEAKLRRLREAREQEQAEREAKAMRAKPKITPMARDLYERKVRGRTEHADAFERLHADRAELEKARAARARAMRKADMDAYTFVPVVNPSPKKKARGEGGPASSSSPDARFQQLYQDGARREEARDDLRERLEVEHTFHPDIGTDKFLQRNESRPAFFARLSQAGAASKSAVLHQLKVEQGLDLRDAETGQAFFHPLVNASSAVLAGSREGPVHERLYATPRKIPVPEPAPQVLIRPASRAKARIRSEKLISTAFADLVAATGGSMETSSFIRTDALSSPEDLPFPTSIALELFRDLGDVGLSSLGLVSRAQFGSLLARFLDAPDVYGPSAYILSQIRSRPEPDDPVSALSFHPVINKRSSVGGTGSGSGQGGKSNPEKEAARSAFAASVRARLGLEPSSSQGPTTPNHRGPPPSQQPPPPGSPLWSFDSPANSKPTPRGRPRPHPRPSNPARDSQQPQPQRRRRERPPWKRPLVPGGQVAWETLETGVVSLDRVLEPTQEE